MKGIEDLKVEEFTLDLAVGDVRPKIARELIIRGDESFKTLHHCIQTMLGWGDDHLHEFIFEGLELVDPGREPEPIKGNRQVGESRMRLMDILRSEGERFLYHYDFGDDWQILVKVKKISPLDKAASRPVCTKGQRNGPLEDSGGPYGYMHVVEVLNDPENEEFEALGEWVGEGFDPEAFDIEQINSLLNHVPYGPKRINIGLVHQKRARSAARSSVRARRRS